MKMRAKLAAEAEHAEATHDADLPYRRKRSMGRQSVYGLRLSAERIEQLRKLAEDRGIEPSVMVRDWIEAHLDAALNTDHHELNQWEKEWRAVSDRMRALLDQRP